MTIRKRRLKVTERPYLAREDVSFCLELPVLFAVSWLLPEKWWPAVCYRLERIKAALGTFSLEPVVATLAKVLPALAADGGARTLALRNAARRSEHHLQILKTYRPGGWRPDIRLEGEENLRRALESGKGAVLWIAHFSFNALAAKKALHAAGYKVWHLSRPEHGFSKSSFGVRFLNPIRVGAEMRSLAGRIVIDRSKPAKAILAARRVLRDNNVVSVTAGAWEGGRVAAGRLLGATIELAIGAPGLSRLTGAPLLPVFSVYDGSLKAIRVVIGEPLTVSGDQRVDSIVQAYLDETVPYVRTYPDQWRGWKSLRVE